MPEVKRSLSPRARPKPRSVITVSYDDPSAVRSALAQWLDGEEVSGEQRLYCPLCEDPDTSVSPSASLNLGKDSFYCQKGDHGSSVHGLIQQMNRDGKSITVRSETTHGVARPTATPRRHAAALPPALDDQEQPEMWHQRITKMPARLAYLTEQRGLSRETIDAFSLGWDGQRYTIPVRTAGEWRAVRRYKPDAESKMFNFKGHGISMLAFTETLDGNALPVIVCEGEFDALLTGQEGAGVFVAITGTGGANNPPKDWSATAGRELFFLYDADTAGREGADKAAKVARADGATTYILDITELGLPFTDSHGADMSDFWLRHDGTVDDVLALIDRARAEDATGYDDIDRAMEAAFLQVGTAIRSYGLSLLSEDQILARPPMSYIVEPFVPRGMVSVFFGQPGSGKTFVAQDIGNCVRAGLDWHGHAVAPGAVLMLQAEGLEQLQARIVAWSEHHGPQTLAAFRALDEPFDLASPEGAAALVRTVRDMEAATGEKVELVWIDPAALYMAGSENEDGNRNLALGLNAVAKYLNIGVLLIVHTNAEGARARGTDHFRMLSGSYVRVEKLDDGRFGAVQEKVKNTFPHAVILNPVSVGPSLVLTSDEKMPAAEYESRKKTAGWTEKASLKMSEFTAANAVKNTRAEQLILDTVRTSPGISKTQLLGRLVGKGIGGPALNAARQNLVDSARIRTEDGPRAALLHHLSVTETEQES